MPKFSRWVVAVGLALCGCGAPSFIVTPVTNVYKLDEQTVAPGKGWFQDKVAIVEVEGMIANAKAGGLLLSPVENPVSLFQQELDKAADDCRVKAVVLRVNSPGGTVSASDAMYTILQKFRQKSHKPVVASAQEIDASGAYYISCAADKIVAQPTSLVGSIGVIFEDFDLSGTLNKLGVEPRNYKSADHKDIGSPFRPARDDEKVILQGLVDEYYGRFKGIVHKNRPIAGDDKVVTDGRVFSGDTAKSLGLVDETGLLADAIELAKRMGKCEDAQVVSYKRPQGYGGSIYALNETPQPQSNALHLELPGLSSAVPAGFYYLWKP